MKNIQYPNACKDARGRLRVGAALGVSKDLPERAEELVAAGVDILVIDSSHGHSRGVLSSLEKVKRASPEYLLWQGMLPQPQEQKI